MPAGNNRDKIEPNRDKTDTGSRQDRTETSPGQHFCATEPKRGTNNVGRGTIMWEGGGRRRGRGRGRWVSRPGGPEGGGPNQIEAATKEPDRKTTSPAGFENRRVCFRILRAFRNNGRGRSAPSSLRRDGCSSLINARCWWSVPVRFCFRNKPPATSFN